jgi:hypothetical protein
MGAVSTPRRRALEVFALGVDANDRAGIEAEVRNNPGAAFARARSGDGDDMLSIGVQN